MYKEWIIKGLEKQGKTRMGLAKALGIAHPQITRMLNGTRRIKADELERISDYIEEPIPAADVQPWPRPSALPVPGRMAVVDEVAAGNWREIDELPQEPIEYIPVGEDPEYRGRKQYAFRVRGSSMNKQVQDGEYVLAVEAFGFTPRDGDFVIVIQRRRGLAERTLKRFRQVNGRAELHPESTDERYKPISLEPSEGTEIEIEAVAIGRWARLGRP